MSFAPSGRGVALVLSAVVLSAPVSLVTTTSASAASYHYANCTALHKDFKHGVGKLGARDKVKGSAKPVTSFKKSTKIYKKAVAYNSNLDRDRDGVACEKR